VRTTCRVGQPTRASRCLLDHPVEKLSSALARLLVARSQRPRQRSGRKLEACQTDAVPQRVLPKIRQCIMRVLHEKTGSTPRRYTADFSVQRNVGPRTRRYCLDARYQGLRHCGAVHERNWYTTSTPHCMPCPGLGGLEPAKYEVSRTPRL
jgi:hypothetical protein